jgi:hypothetical protein
MSTFAQRKEQPGWFEPSDRTEISPASLWAPEYEDEIAQIKARAFRAPKSPRPHLVTEPDWKDTPGEIKEPSSLWTREEIVDTEANEQAQEKPEALLWVAANPSEDTNEGTSADTELQEEADTQPTSFFVSEAIQQVETLPETDSIATQNELSEAGPPEPKVKSAVLPRKIPRRPLVLDESAVLPSEASYATVPMHRDVVSQPRVLDETAVLPSEASYATVPMYRDVVSRPRVLDDTAVLPGEASFATVRLYQKPARSRYSANRFTPSFVDRAKQLLPALLVVAVCSAAIIFRMAFKTTNDIVQSSSEVIPATEPLALQPEKALPEPQPEITSNPSGDVTLSSSPKEPTSAPPAADTPIEHRVAVTPKTAEKTVPRVRSERETRPNKNERSESKESGIATRKASIPRSNEDDVPIQSTSSVRTEPAANSANDATKTETQSQPAVTGGGDRPRRVNPQADPTP